jgi:ABC-type polysaccharide/polyol phosphate export permease
VLGTAPPDLPKALVGGVVTIAFVVVGLWYFRRSEPKFADTI